MSKNREQYEPLVLAAADKYGLDRNIALRWVNQESGFNPKAVSSAGALGIMQIMPNTAKGWGVDPLDPAAAIDTAFKNLMGYAKTYQGDLGKALAAYNAGPGAVAKYGGIPPYAETQNYVKNILGGAPLKKSGSQVGMGSNPASGSNSVDLSYLNSFDPLISPELFQSNALNSGPIPGSSFKPYVPDTKAIDDLINRVHNQQPKTNFFGDVVSGAKSVFDPNTSPGGGGVGSTIGQTAALTIPAIAAGLTPLGIPGAIATAAGLGGLNEHNQQLREGKTPDALRTSVGAASNLVGFAVPELKGANLLSRMAKNAVPDAFITGGSSAALQAAREGQIDPARTLNDTVLGVAGGAILRGVFGRKQPKVEPTQVPTEVKQALGLPERSSFPEMNPGKPYQGPVSGLLPGGTETPLAGPGTLVRENIPPYRAPQDFGTPGTPLLPAGASPAGLLPERSSFPEMNPGRPYDAPVAGYLESGRTLMTPETTQSIPVEGTGIKMVRPTTHGGLQTPMAVGGTLERTTQGAFLQGLGRTEGQPTAPVRQGTVDLPLGAQAAPEVPTTRTVPNNRTTSVVNQMKKRMGLSAEEVAVEPAAKGQVTVKATPDPQYEPLRQQYLKDIADPAADVNTLYRNLEKQKKTLLKSQEVSPSPKFQEEVTSPSTKPVEGPLNVKKVSEVPPKDQGTLTGQSGVSGEVSFKTSQGSEYTFSKGSTTRNKSLHFGHDATDVGIKQPSDRTIFIKPEDIEQVQNALYTKGQPKPSEMYVKGNQLLVRNYIGKNATPKDTIIPFTTEPAVGAHPLEFMKDSKHLGNVITEVKESIKTPIDTPKGGTAAPEPAPTLSRFSKKVGESFGPGGKAYVHLGDAMEAQALRPKLFQGQRRSVVQKLNEAIQHNRNFPEQGITVQGTYRGSRTSAPEKVSFTPMGFFDGNYGVGVHGVNSNGHYANYYLDAHLQKGSGFEGKLTTELTDKAQYDFKVGNPGREKPLHTDKFREAKKEVRQIKDLAVDAEPELKKSIQRIHKIAAKQKIDVAEAKQVVAELERMKARGSLDKFLKQIEDITGKCK